MRARPADDVTCSDSELPEYIEQQSGWTIEGDKVHVPANPDNDVKATIIREDLQLDREWLLCRVSFRSFTHAHPLFFSFLLLELTKFLSQAHTPILRA